MSFNLNQFFKLLTEKRKLEKKGKFMWEENLFGYEKLLNYITNIKDQVFFENINNYRKIMEDFIDEKICIKRFCHLYCDLWKKDEKRTNRLITSVTLQEGLPFKINLKISGLSRFIDSIAIAIPCSSELPCVKNFMPESIYNSFKSIYENEEEFETILLESTIQILIRIILSQLQKLDE